MGKHYGDHYDPELRKSEHGAKIYAAWKKMRSSPYCKEWGYFPNFYNWAINNGYSIGAWLRRHNRYQSYSPENCFWRMPKDKVAKQPSPPTWEETWNKTVNRIRKHYGMPPLEGTDYGSL